MALFACAAFATSGCSKTATTRVDQEAEFKELFGIVPSAAVVKIRYHDSSGIGGYIRWMSFTYDAATYDAVLKKGGYKLSEVSMGGSAESSGAPAWWPKAHPPQPTLYSRSQDDTPENEGYQFEEFLWHDSSSGIVYLSKAYWD